MTGELKSMILIGVALAILVGSMSAMANVEQFSVKDAEEQQQQVIPRNKLIAVPNALSKFLFYNTRPERQFNTPLGYKRSSSALDALTGVTLGKRTSPVELINMEPYLSRQNGMRFWPRMYDLRWAPYDYYETPTEAQ